MSVVHNLLGLTDHLLNFVAVCGLPLKIVPRVHCGLLCYPRNLLCYPRNLYKIIIHQHIICFMLPSGCCPVIEMKKFEKLQKVSVYIFLY